VVEAYLDVPRDARMDYLILEDESGAPVEMQVIDRQETRAGLYHPRSRNMPFYCTRVHLHFLAKDVPALGYKTFKLKWKSKNEYPYPHEEWDPPRIYAQNLVTEADQMENEFLHVRVNSDGTFALTDKVAGRTYDRLNYFQDSGDRGNEAMSDAPGNNVILRSLGRKAFITQTLEGPLVAKLAIELKMTLPAEYDWSAQKRSTAKKSMPITIEMTLRKGSRFLEVKTTVRNTVKDHFFKVCFPTGLSAQKTWSQGSFTVDEFPVRPSVEGEMRGKELARHPARLWFDLADDKHGLAVLSDAAKDYEILEHKRDQTLAMVLMRCVRMRIPCDNRLWMEYPGDESSQLPDKVLTYNYALMPHTGRWDQAGLSAQASAFNAPMHVCQFGKQKGSLPLNHSFLELKGANLILSGVKKAEDRDSILVRFYNPTAHDVDGALHVGFDVKQAQIVSLNEQVQQPLTLKGRQVQFKAGRGKIITIELIPAQPIAKR
jgi:alpha-mannosidase